MWGNNLIRLHKGLSAPEQILHNWFEIRQRYYLYREKADKSFEIDFEKIGDSKETKKMFDYFGIKHRKLSEKAIKPNFPASQERTALLDALLESWKNRGARKSISTQDHFFRRMEKREREREGAAI